MPRAITVLVITRILYSIIGAFAFMVPFSFHFHSSDHSLTSVDGVLMICLGVFLLVYAINSCWLFNLKQFTRTLSMILDIVALILFSLLLLPRVPMDIRRVTNYGDGIPWLIIEFMVVAIPMFSFLFLLTKSIKPGYCNREA